MLVTRLMKYVGAVLRLTAFLDYFTKLLEDDLRAIVKPQYVDQIPKSIRGPNKTVRSLLTSRATLGNLEEVCDTLGKSQTRTDV